MILVLLSRFRLGLEAQGGSGCDDDAAEAEVSTFHGYSSKTVSPFDDPELFGGRRRFQIGGGCYSDLFHERIHFLFASGIDDKSYYIRIATRRILHWYATKHQLHTKGIMHLAATFDGVDFVGAPSCLLSSFYDSWFILRSCRLLQGDPAVQSR